MYYVYNNNTSVFSPCTSVMFLLVHSKVKTSAEEVKSKLFTEDNTNCKLVKFMYSIY